MSDDTSTALHPFRLAIPDADLADLRDRLARTRWAAPLPGAPWERGVPVDYLRNLAAYWRDGFDWRAAEAEINRYPQFTTRIDGADVHFLHVRSTHDDALPLLLGHGWPGSIVEFLQVIDPLTQPERHGGDPADAFHLVIPSIPGFTLSGPVEEAGWDDERIATAFVTLMRRLGYDRYGVQGGDFGAVIAPAMGRHDPAGVVGVHVNAATKGFGPSGWVSDDERASLSDLDRDRLDRSAAWLASSSGYTAMMGTKPATIGHALTDSPVGQLAWIVELFHTVTDPAKALPEDAVDRDQLLAGVSLYWLTATAASSANLYYEDMHDADGSVGWGAPAPVASPGDGVPTGVAVFAADVAIRHYAERHNRITWWNDFATGGHFAAMETPDLLVRDVRGFFRTVR